ncbi:MAG: pyrimidine-nucleoside phosphorylase, partial [Chloroflexota bacterium]|nr:pyrimidine-nucleoside phosphorylase [Chloroflexota bacterium]
RMVDDPARLPRAADVVALDAPRTGYVAAIVAEQIGLASMRLGAGREVKGQPIDHATGIVLRAKVGDRVERGQAFAEVHRAGRPGDDEATETVRRAFRWSARRVPRRRLVLGRIAAP